MNGKDILLFTRGFWPQCGLTELAIAELALNLKSAGHKITIATLRWSKQWSEKIDFHGIPVIRFARPVYGPWNWFRYGNLFSRQLSTTSYDAVIVSGASDETAAVIRCMDEAIPVIMRWDAQLCGPGTSFHRKHVECCLRADAIVANCQAVADFISGNEDMPRVRVVRDGIHVHRKRIPESVYKRRVREALGVAHPILQTRTNEPLAITFVPFVRGSGLLKLVENWARVLSRLPQAKLWLLGDGPESSQLWHAIAKLNLADLFIHPADQSVPSDGLVRALAAGVPVVSTDVPELNQLIDLEPHCRLDLGVDWSQAILNQLIDRSLGVPCSKVVARREAICRYFSPQQQVQQFMKLVESGSANQVSVVK